MFRGGFYRVFFTGLNTTINHHTTAWPAMVVAVRTSPLMAKRGMKYVRMEAVGMLAVLRGTWEFLLSTVGRAKKARPALPIEIKMSTSAKLGYRHFLRPRLVE